MIPKIFSNFFPSDEIKPTSIAADTLSSYSTSASARAELHSVHQWTGLLPWYKKPFLKQQAHFELAWTSFDMKSKMIEYTYAGNCEGLKKVKVDYNKKSIHPAQKPFNLYRILLKDYAKENDKILDTHGGSMTIAKACDIEGYDLDICEIDKTYFDNGLKAFNEYKKQTTLF